MNKLLTTLTSMAAFSFLTTTSQATVFWDFVQEGNNVTATASGHFDTPVPSSSSGFSSLPSGGVGPRESLCRDGGWYTSTNAGTSGDNPFVITSTSFLSDLVVGSFGFYEGALLWPVSYGDTLDITDNVNASMTFNNKSLSNLGVTRNDAGTVMWQLKDTTDVGNAIVLKVNGQVPEPSSTALLGLGTLCLLARRKR